jgi:hypothetical protein
MIKLVDLDSSSDASRGPSRLRGRLWAAGGALALVALCLAAVEIAQAVREPGGELSLGHDLLPSYTAGLLVREGRADLLYDAQGFEQAARGVMVREDLAGNPRLAPWVNPPFVAWLFVPLSVLPYRAAAVVWLGFSLLLFAGSIMLLCRMLARGASWRTWGLAPLLLVASVPFWQALSHLQNTFLSLALLCTAVALWRAGYDLSAGLVAGLMFFKPQMALVVVAVMALTTGRRAVAGVLVTSVGLLLVTALTMPGSLDAFISRVPEIAHGLQTDHAYNWGRQVTFQAFWRLLLQGHVRGETEAVVKVLAAACSLTVAAGLGAAAWHATRGGTRRDPSGRLVAAAVVCTPLLVPYYMDYDLLLLAVAAVLFAGGAGSLDEDVRSVDHWLTRTWVGLFVAITVGPAVASSTRLHPVIPLLAATAALSVHRCLRGREKADTIRAPECEPAALAA